jgi:hypothetical protein
MSIIKPIKVDYHIVDFWSQKTDVMTEVANTFSKKEPYLISGAIACAVAAIALGILAIQASAGLDPGIFHPLGAVGWFSVSAGVGGLTLGIPSYCQKIARDIEKIDSNMLSQKKLGKLLERENKNIWKLLLDNKSEIDRIFTYLSTLKRKGSAIDSSQSKFCVWKREAHKKDDPIFVLQVKGGERKISVFFDKAEYIPPETKDEPLEQAFVEFREKLIEEKYQEVEFPAHIVEMAKYQKNFVKSFQHLEQVASSKYGENSKRCDFTSFRVGDWEFFLTLQEGEYNVDVCKLGSNEAWAKLKELSSTGIYHFPQIPQVPDSLS